MHALSKHKRMQVSLILFLLGLEENALLCISHELNVRTWEVGSTTETVFCGTAITFLGDRALRASEARMLDGLAFPIM